MARAGTGRGEADVFEAIAAVKRRFKIDDKRVMLRGFSMGGEGAWHMALHHPDRFAAAESGRVLVAPHAVPGLTPYQAPFADLGEHGGVGAERFQFAAGRARWRQRHADRIAARPPPGTPSRGQLESSLRTREQLAKEDFPAEGEPDFLDMKGTPAIFMISENTGHTEALRVAWVC